MHYLLCPKTDEWTHSEWTLELVQNILKLFTFDQRLLVRDSYECHIKESANKDLKAKKVESLSVPGGCTKYAHAPDVSWNKDFKAKVVDKYQK